MKKFAAGFIAGSIATILGIVALDVFWTSPLLDVGVEIPTSATLDSIFYMKISISNPHSELVTLGNVDIPNAFLESFEVVTVTPRPIDDSPISGFGTNTWYFDVEVQPETTKIITFDVRPTARGRHVIEFYVCNSTEDCTLIAKPIEVL